MKKPWVVVLCACALGGSVVLLGTAIYNVGVNSAKEKAKIAESENVESEVSSSSEKKNQRIAKKK